MMVALKYLSGNSKSIFHCFYYLFKVAQLCPTLCDPEDGSPPGSAVPGILQARTLGLMKPEHLREGIGVKGASLLTV